MHFKVLFIPAVLVLICSCAGNNAGKKDSNTSDDGRVSLSPDLNIYSIEGDDFVADYSLKAKFDSFEKTARKNRKYVVDYDLQHLKTNGYQIYFRNDSITYGDGTDEWIVVTDESWNKHPILYLGCGSYMPPCYIKAAGPRIYICVDYGFGYDDSAVYCCYDVSTGTMRTSSKSEFNSAR